MSIAARLSPLFLLACAIPSGNEPPNAQGAPPITLELGEATPGAMMDFAVRGATPGARVLLGVSTRAGSGPCPAILGGACLGIVGPILVGDGVADANGDWFHTVMVPSSVATGVTVYAQAVADSDLSPVNSVVVDVATPPGTDSTIGVLCNESYSVMNTDESVDAVSTADWSCDATSRTLIANGLPDHEVGTFPNANNPNAISEQDVEVEFPLFPEIVSATGEETLTVAYCLNGVKFEVGTAGTCTDDGTCSAIGNGGAWRMEAVGDNSFDFGNDDSNGHVQPTGTYHYHGMPEGYLTQLGAGVEVTQVGWAVDGFPIYARYGYADANNPNSAVVAMTSSYSQIQTLPAGRPDVNIYPLGSFTQDWEYTPGTGDLDECNGRFGVTPEFPDGIYHYYLTDSFPFGQRCVKGEISGGGGPGGPGGPGGTVATCDTVPVGMPCCGDNVCDGPETATNCPDDC